jgi:NTE family protein
MDNKTHKIVGLSGTSGGAICALLAWKYLLLYPDGNRKKTGSCLTDLWTDNTARNLWEIWWDQSTVGITSLLGTGIVPEFKASPYSGVFSRSLELVQDLAPRRNFVDFECLLKAHVDFADLRKRAKSPCPRLLLGAADVKEGKFKAFDSWQEEIMLNAVLSSAAIPTLFRAVEVDSHYYWDGLFSENPPIKPFLSGTDKELKPQEIWIIQINPDTRDDVPESMPGILDRRNELAGNLALRHEIDNILRINKWAKGGFTETRKKRYRNVTLRKIEMSESLAEELDYASKLNRSSTHITALIDDGEKQADAFLSDLKGHEIPPEDEPDIVPNYEGVF